MKHPTTLPSIDMDSLVRLLSDLRYDALARFLLALAKKIDQDGQDDICERNRIQLGTALGNVAAHLTAAGAEMERCWTICKPYEMAPVEKNSDLPEPKGPYGGYYSREQQIRGEEFAKDIRKAIKEGAW